MSAGAVLLVAGDVQIRRKAPEQVVLPWARSPLIRLCFGAARCRSVNGAAVLNVSAVGLMRPGINWILL